MPLLRAQWKWIRSAAEQTLTLQRAVHLAATGILLAPRGMTTAGVMVARNLAGNMVTCVNPPKNKMTMKQGAHHATVRQFGIAAEHASAPALRSSTDALNEAWRHQATQRDW